jgi:hypothetical protein
MLVYIHFATRAIYSLNSDEGDGHVFNEELDFGDFCCRGNIHNRERGPDRHRGWSDRNYRS